MSRLTAHAIAWIFNPGALVFALLVLGVTISSFSNEATIGWFLLLGLAGLAGVIILLVAWAHGLVIDVDLMTPINLRDRSRIVVFFLAVLTLLLLVSFRAGKLEPLHTILLTLLVLGAVVAVITLVWKISLHMLAVGTFTAAFLFILGPSWWAISLLVPLVAWSRLRLHRHTPYQVLGGFLLGVAVTSAVFWWSGLV